MAQIYDPGTQRQRTTERAGVQGHPHPHSKFKANLDCLRPCLKDKRPFKSNIKTKYAQTFMPGSSEALDQTLCVSGSRLIPQVRWPHGAGLDQHCEGSSLCLLLPLLWEMGEVRKMGPPFSNQPLCSHRLTAKAYGHLSFRLSTATQEHP